MEDALPYLLSIPVLLLWLGPAFLVLLGGLYALISRLSMHVHRDVAPPSVVQLGLR